MGKSRRIFSPGVKLSIGDAQLTADFGHAHTQLGRFRAKAICSSVNRNFFIGTTSAQGSGHHAGILFLSGAGSWGSVID